MKASGFVQGLFYKAERLLSPTLPRTIPFCSSREAKSQGALKRAVGGSGRVFSTGAGKCVSSRNTWLRIKMRANLPKETRPLGLRQCLPTRIAPKSLRAT